MYIPTPIMVLAVILGITVCFSGNPLKKFWLPVRSFAVGALVFVIAVQFIVSDQITSLLFSKGATLKALWGLISNDQVWWYTLLKVIMALAGGTGFFFLAKSKHKWAIVTTRILTAITTADIIALLIATSGFAVVTVPMMAVIASVLTLILIPICLLRFDYYYSAETGLAGALLTSYMFYTFYYLSAWMFWLLALILAFCGIYMQEYMAIKARKKQIPPADTPTINEE